MKRRISRAQCRARLAVPLLLIFCFGGLVLMQSHFNTVVSLAAPPHRDHPKIAFLFIARNRLALDFVWDAFFRGEKEGRFSVFVHSRPGFLFNEVTTRSAYFHGRQVNNCIQVCLCPCTQWCTGRDRKPSNLSYLFRSKVEWGESSMIQAERILLKNALKNSLNEQFLFLSDSCIPLYNFSYTYDYIMSTTNSFLDSHIMLEAVLQIQKRAVIIQKCIRLYLCIIGGKALRKHAEIVLNDETVFPEFQKHCRRKSLPEFWRDRPLPADGSKEHNCIPDEHYVQTLLAQKGLEGEINRRTLTHTAWDLSSTKNRERGGWHPLTYKHSDATPMLLKTIMGIDNVFYETEHRREWCSSKGKPSPCFLFARKFTRPAALRLLNTSALVVN